MLIKAPQTFIISLLLVVTFSCNSDNDDYIEDTTYSFSEEINSITPQQTNPKPIVFHEQIIKEVKTTQQVQRKSIPTKKNETKNYRITPNQLDSMNKIIPIYDSLRYDGVTINYFTNLSTSLKGRPFFVDNARQVNDAVMGILSSRINDQTDVVLLIDKTGSMADDWEVVKNSLTQIMHHLSNYDNVRLGIASYGDKNYHLDFWYNWEDLSYDIDKLQTFMDTYYTMGNPDTRESVNDAIVRTIDNMSWDPNSNRVMIIIGDAPSQLPPLSDYTMEDAIKVCKSKNVLFNLYPIIISSIRNTFNDVPAMTNFAKVYPNPAINDITIETAVPKPLSYEIIDLTGKTILNGFIGSNKYKVNLSSLTSGTYLVTVYNQNYSNYHTSKLIKK